MLLSLWPHSCNGSCKHLFHYYLISNLRGTDERHYGNIGHYYRDQWNKNGCLHEASASFSFFLFPKTAFNNKFSNIPLLKAQAGIWKEQLFLKGTLFCFPIHLTGIAVENPCQFCAPAGQTGNVSSQGYQGTLVSKMWTGKLLSLRLLQCLVGVTSTTMNQGHSAPYEHREFLFCWDDCPSPWDHSLQGPWVHCVLAEAK